MIRLIQILLTVLISSFFLFPFNLPITGAAINTKMILAVIGVLLFILDTMKAKMLQVSKDFLILSLICIAIGIWALGVTLQNMVDDNSFVTYLISVWVWIGAAYAIVWIIRSVHGKVTVEIVGNYLIGVCVFQCILAYLMSLFPSLRDFIINVMRESYSVRYEGRLFGLGAALDPAGLRFSGVLAVLSFLISQTDFSHKKWTGFAYILSFFIIAVIGNIISRTTIVGLVIGLIYWMINSFSGKNKSNSAAFYSMFAPIFVVLLILMIWLYHVSPSFHDNIRFGFEGFFSLVEKGRWEVHSNDVLEKMIIWPESLKTWIIGDGFFMNPTEIPDRFGQVSVGFYMHTDIGYLRYIFYFGVIGLLLMMAVPIQITASCCRSMPEYKGLFIMFLLVTFTGWLKVSSDIIMVFAPFLVLAYEADTTAHSAP